MLLKHKFGQERANSLQIEQLYDVDFLGKALASFLMSLKFLYAPLKAFLLTDALAAAETAQQASKHIFAVIVEVLTSLSNLMHHGTACLRLTLYEFPAALIRKFLWVRAGRVDCPDQRILQLECFIAAQKQSKSSP